MKQELEAAIAEAVKELFDARELVELTRPEEQFGDYSTNVALQLAKPVGKAPREIADTLSSRLREDLADKIDDVSVAGPGFINLKLSDKALVEAAHSGPGKTYEGQEILVEFGDPNPLKEMHLGHLYTTVVGDSISRLFEAAGGRVHRVSYHGDVGMHVAKAIYGIGEEIDWKIEQLSQLEPQESSEGMTVKSRIGYLYAKGARAYENNPEAADKIRDINKHVYAKDDELINTIYDWGVRVSFSYFDEIFKALGVEFEKRYLESEATGIGVATVRQHIGDVFSESQGAVIFAGEEHGLHTRVFINSEGLPTYEAKDLGLAELKNQDYLDVRRSIIITANEQTEYFKVMLAALKQFQPELASITTHIAHGFLSLTTGKMSSRTGDVHSAQTLLDDVAKSVEEAYPDSAVSKEVYVAAIKYAFLKQRIGGNITFDVQESVALEGHSGPYLQYAHARARSILRKAQGASGERRVASGELQAGERSLTRKIGEYAEVVDQAVNELMPHHVATYLYELAQNFNRFYENNRVVGDERQELRLNLVSSYADTLKNGLELLGIAAPDKM